MFEEYADLPDRADALGHVRSKIRDLKQAERNLIERLRESDSPKVYGNIWVAKITRRGITLVPNF